MKIILGTNRYTGRPLEILRSEVPAGFEFRMLSEQTEECFLRSVSDADYILAGGRTRVTAAVLKSAARLKMVQRSGVGLDALDLDALKQAGIPLYVNQGVNAESVAEHALMLILACLRRLPEINRNTHEGQWRKQEQGIRTTELRGKTVGIIGMGNVGLKLAELLRPFEVEILYSNLFRLPADQEEREHMRFADVDTILANSQVVSLHCALTPETRGLIGENAIRKMKDGAILINTARGELVDPVALKNALESGKLSFAALDVHTQEPIREDYPLLGLGNVILTPHVAGVTEDSFRAMMHDAFRNIDCFEQGRLSEIEPYRYL